MVKCIWSKARVLLLVALLTNLLAWSPIGARLHTPDARTAANPVQMAAFGPAPQPWIRLTRLLRTEERNHSKEQLA